MLHASGADSRQIFAVAPVAEMPPGSSKIVVADRTSVGVFNVDGTYHALRNSCPHQGGPLCRGAVTGTTEADDPSEVRFVRDGEIVRCPWHHWEFDITTGESLFNRRRRVRKYETAVVLSSDISRGDFNGKEEEWVVVTIPETV